MPYNRRQQRRQGVRYGPPRARESFSDNGALIGRFLGLGILLLAIGVLAAGALAFVGDRPAASSTPRRTSTFVALPPSIEVTPSPLATLPPAPSPTASVVLPSTVPSPTPTSVPPLVQIGEGFVTFGTRSDDQLHVIDPRSVFRIDERIVWSAYLTERADSAELRIQISKLDSTAIGGERLIRDDEVTPLVSDAQIFRRRIRPSAALEGAGVYAVRYVRGTEILSEGFMEITT